VADGVLELADVGRPIVRTQHGHEGEAGSVAVASETSEKMADEGEQVFFSFA
jgi:hypothetical protein